MLDFKSILDKTLEKKKWSLGGDEYVDFRHEYFRKSIAHELFGTTSCFEPKRRTFRWVQTAKKNVDFILNQEMLALEMYDVFFNIVTDATIN